MALPDSFCIHAAIHPQDGGLCDNHKVTEFDQVDVLRIEIGSEFAILDVRLYVAKSKLEKP